MGRYHGNPYSFSIPSFALVRQRERIRERQRGGGEGDGDIEIERPKGRPTEKKDEARERKESELVARIGKRRSEPKRRRKGGRGGEEGGREREGGRAWACWWMEARENDVISRGEWVVNGASERTC